MQPSPYNSGAQPPRIISEMTQALGPTCQLENQLVVTNKDFIVYPSGSFIVFYNTQLNQQVKYISHRTHLISAIAVSPDSTQLAVAESSKNGEVVIYDITPIDSVLTKPLRNLPLKKGTINLLLYSPNSRYLIGISNDQNLLVVWDGDKVVTKSKVSSEPKRINKALFAEDGTMMTVGQQHFKIWTFNEGQVARSRTVGIRKDMVDKEFVNIASRNNYTVALTSDGFLCKVNKDGNVFQHTEMVQSMNALQIIGSEAIVGGRNSDVRVFNLDTLKSVRLFKKPPPQGYENIEKNATANLEVKNAKYPRCLAVKALSSNRVVTLYDNKMIFVWMVAQNSSVAEKSFIGHRDEIACATMLEEISQTITFFATSSRDNTIRIWHIYDECFDNLTMSVDIASVVDIKRNAYCRNLTRIIYTDDLVRHIRCYHSRLLAFSRSRLDFYLLTDFSLEHAFTLDNEATCIELSGDRIYQGCTDQTVRIFSLENGVLSEAESEYKLKHPLQSIVAHGKEIYCLGKGTLSVISQVSNSIISVYSNVDCVWSHLKTVYWSSQSKLTIYNTDKGKPKPPVQMRSLLNLRPAHIIRSTGSYILTVKNDEIPNIVTMWDLDGKYLCEEIFGESINDVMCTEGGDTVIVGKSGAVIIWKFAYEEKLKKFRNLFQDKLLKESLTGSIWLEGSTAKIPPAIIGSRNSPMLSQEPSKVQEHIPEKPNELEQSSPCILEVPQSKLSGIRLLARASENPTVVHLPTIPTSPRSEIRKPPPLVHPSQIHPQATVPPTARNQSTGPITNIANYSSVPTTTVPTKVNNFMSPQRTTREGDNFNPSQLSNQLNQIIQNVSNVQKKHGLQDLVIADSTHLGAGFSNTSINSQQNQPAESIILQRNFADLAVDSVDFGKLKEPGASSSVTPSKGNSDQLGLQCNSVTIANNVLVETSEVQPFIPRSIADDDSIVQEYSEEQLAVTRFQSLLERASHTPGQLDKLFQQNKASLEKIYRMLDNHFGRSRREKQKQQAAEIHRQYQAKLADIFDDNV